MGIIARCPFRYFGARIVPRYFSLLMKMCYLSRRSGSAVEPDIWIYLCHRERSRVWRPNFSTYHNIEKANPPLTAIVTCHIASCVIGKHGLDKSACIVVGWLYLDVLLQMISDANPPYSCARETISPFCVDQPTKTDRYAPSVSSGARSDGHTRHHEQSKAI